MAVEIPVVIDIDKAFQDAAKKVPGAMKPLMKSIEDLEGDLSAFRDKMNSYPATSKSFEAAAKNVQKLEQAIELLHDRVNALTSNEGSIRSFSNELSSIRRRFDEMGKGQMFDVSGALSADAKKLQADYARVATELDKAQKILTAEYDAQVKTREEAERQKKVLAEQAQASAEHQKALNLVATTIGELGVKTAAWRKELTSATNPSTFSTAAREVQRLVDETERLNAQTRILGSSTGSINQLNAKLQEITRQYNALSGADRNGAPGKALVNDFRKLSAEFDKEAKSLQKIVDLEKRLQSIAHDRTRSRQYENAVLNSTANTMHRLSEQARILTERLERAKIGTKTFDDLKIRLDEVRQKMERLRGSASGVTSALNSQSVVLRNLSSYASMYISVFGAMRFVKSIRDVTAELEYQRVALGRLIQDEEYGNALFERIKESAVKSPFRIKELVTYTKQLAAYRIEQENLFDTTRRLADVSAGLGVDMNRLILAYGQVRAASVLRGQELRQFTEAGIPLVELLAEKMGELNKTSYSTADVFKLISARAVPFSAIAEIFEDLTEKGGMFYKMQEEQAKTLKGRWEKLKDTYDIALQSIGESKGLLSFTSYNNLILSGLEKLASGLRIIPKILEGASLAWLVYYAATTKSRIAIQRARIEETKRTFATNAASIAQAKGVKNTDAYTMALIRQRAANTALSRSFWKLWAAVVANPWGAAIAAVLGLVTAFVSFRKKTDDVTASLADFKLAVENLANAEKTFEKTEKLIDSYSELASKTNRTEEENRRLEKTMSRLQDMFPGLAKSIDGETASLSENVDALKKENELRLKLSREEAEQRLLAAKLTKDQQQKELNEMVAAREKAYAEMKQEDTLVNFYGYGSEKKLEKLTQKFNDLDAKVQEARNSISSLDDSIAALENYLNPKSTNAVTEAWKDQVEKLNDYKNSLGQMTIFTPKDIEDLESVYDLYKKLKKLWTEAKTSMEGLKSAYEEATEPLIKAKLLTEFQDAKALFDAIEKERAFFGFDFNKKTRQQSYQQDPFIATMQERIKFMKDFKKGYDDLRKYMSENGALMAESGVMLFRGQSLGMSQEEQAKAAKNLSDWYKSQIDNVIAEMRKKGFSVSDVGEVLSASITGTGNRAKMQRDFQKLLQSLWDAKTDLDISEKKKEIEDALKKLENEIKRSETARNFFQDIFDLTGDEQLAANMAVSVYGEPGKELADRIRESIQGAMSAEGIKSDSGTWSRLVGAAEKMDFRDVMKDISSLPEGVQKAVQEASSAIEKYNADIAKSYAQLLMSYDDIEQERVNINQQAARKIKAIESGLQLELRAIAERGGDEGAASAARKRAAEAMLAVEREQRSELYKLTDEYRLFFNTVNILSVENARSIAAKQKKILADRLANEEISFARYKRELKEIDEQLKKYENRTSPFLLYLKDGLEALMEQSKEAAEDIQGLAASIGKSSIGDGGVFSPDASARAFLDKCDRVFNKGLFARIFHRKNTITIEQRISAASTQAYNEAYNNAIMRGKSDDVAKAIAQSQAASAASAEASSAAAEAAGAASSAASGVAWAEFWIRLIYSVLSNIDERITKGGKEAAPKWLDYLASGVTWTWGKVGEGAWDKLADVNSHAIKWLEEVKSGDIFGSLFTFGDAIYDIFRPKSVREANREIKEQSDIITDLERSYSRLEVAIQDAFGSDYIYNFNRQLELLEMEAEAYRKQAESERSKGKDADEDVAKGYERSAEDVENKIKDMRSQLADFFSGTDAASAAKDFAKAWIEAYKEFGSTTDAISQKFNDMIESMVVNSLAAQLIQGILNPVFEAIDTASKDGALSADDIGAISAMVPGRVAMINDAMNTLMSQLLSTGIDLQRQAGNFTGISRNIAGASEESILSLAAGINTQNYYMSHIDINVASILAAITGDETAGPNRAKSSGPTSVQYNEQMLEYASSIPMMRDDMASVRAMLERVIKPVGTPASHYVSARV